MRYLAAALVFAAALASSATRAEKRIFIVENNSDGYGVDRCLATGAACGMPVATAYCQARDYAQVASFRKADSDEVVGLAGGTASDAPAHGEFVAIECLR